VGAWAPPARWFGWLVLACLLALTPSRIAHWHFDRFLALGSARSLAGSSADQNGDPRAGEAARDTQRSESGESSDRLAERSVAASRHLELAVRFDPAFPLYRFRRGLESATEEQVAELRSAALSARGLGLLWLVAGARAGQGGVFGYREELERACDLDAFGPLAPFVLAVLAPADQESPERLARALLSEPRLAASARLDETARLVEEALAMLEKLDRVPVGWRAAIVEQVRSAEPVELGADADVMNLTLELDALGSTSLSLYAFRRRPTRLPVLSVQVAREGAARITAPGALDLAATERGALAEGCRLAPPSAPAPAGTP
jgi:hypothetical protein